MRASHPLITFGSGRRPASRPRLVHATLTFHAPRCARPTALRSPTSGFSFPVVGRLGRVAVRRSVLQPGLPRARRA